ncbi:MAG: NADH-quinone oxidoreductase subunit A [Candidatus Eisenbacteria bacterium]|nr:NADH-quinone oxidoreductase subunit A [Candidatus Eisenbacteria bacterium]
MEFHFATVLVFIVVGVGFAAFTLGLGKILRPFAPGAEKQSIYECGERPVGSPWIKFNIRFYVVALIFVVFDVEIVLLYPWATVFKQMGVVSFVYLLIFLVSLLEALAYVWKKGDLEWVRPQVRREDVKAPLPLDERRIARKVEGIEAKAEAAGGRR